MEIDILYCANGLSWENLFALKISIFISHGFYFGFYSTTSTGGLNNLSRPQPVYIYVWLKYNKVMGWLYRSVDKIWPLFIFFPYLLQIFQVRKYWNKQVDSVTRSMSHVCLPLFTFYIKVSFQMIIYWRNQNISGVLIFFPYFYINTTF